MAEQEGASPAAVPEPSRPTPTPTPAAPGTTSSAPFEVEDGVFIGGLQHGSSGSVLSSLGITHVVNLSGFFLDTTSHCHQLLVEVDDKPTTDLLQFLPLTTPFITGALAKGGKVLVHCLAGVSRSSSVIVAHMIQEKGASLAAALGVLRRARPAAQPNSGFMTQLAILEASGGSLALASQLWMNRRAAALAATRERRGPEQVALQYLEPAPKTASPGPCAVYVPRRDSPGPGPGPSAEAGPAAEVETAVEAVMGKVKEKNETTERMAVLLRMAMERKRAAQAGQAAKPPPGTRVLCPGQARSFKCTLCDHPLAFERSLMAHPMTLQFAGKEAGSLSRDDLVALSRDKCKAYAVLPVDWMASQAKDSESGALVCPNKDCQAQVGTFSWSKADCPCGSQVPLLFALKPQAATLKPHTTKSE